MQCITRSSLYTRWEKTGPLVTVCQTGIKYFNIAQRYA